MEVGGQRTHLRATQQRPLAAPLATMHGGERMVVGGYILIIIEQNALQTVSSSVTCSVTAGALQPRNRSG